MTSQPPPPVRPRGAGPQLIRTMGSVLLAGFAVVLIVSVTTIAGHGTDAYLPVMLTLAMSLVIVMVATLVAGALVARMRAEEAPDSGPSSEVQRLRAEFEVLKREIDKHRPAP